MREHLSTESLVYVADRKNFPYGEKSPSRVREVVVALAQALLNRFDPKLLVVACNTASVHSLSALRASLPIPVVGVVPAVKVAAQVTRSRRIGVIATELTVRSPYLHDLIYQHAPHCQVFSLSAGDIVRFVEDEFFRPVQEERDQLLGLWGQRVRELEVDTVVLGCTHFLHVIPQLKLAFGPSITLVDSREGVGRRTQFLLEQASQLASGGSRRLEFWVHWDRDQPLKDREEEKYQLFAHRFGLAYRGVFWTD